jgi:hypothetical protein
MAIKRKLGRTAYQVFPLGLGGDTYPIGEGADGFATPDERAALMRGAGARRGCAT